MNQGNIQFYSPAGAASAPGTVSDANDGLQLQGTAAKLGQVPGTAGNPAKLTEGREVPLNGKRFSLAPVFGVDENAGPGSNEGRAFVNPGFHWYAGGPASGDSQTAAIFEPSNYGVTYNSGASGTGSRFTTSWALFPGVNPDGRPNMVGNFWGYNVNPGGGQILAGEFSFRYGTETYFRQSGNYLSEHHLPEIIDTAGHFHRLWSMYIVRASGYTFLQSQINSFEYFRFDNAIDSYGSMYNEFDTGNTAISLVARGGLFGPPPGGDGSGFAEVKLTGGDGKVGVLRAGAAYGLSLINGTGPICVNAITDVQMTDYVLFPFPSSLFGGDKWTRLQARLPSGGFKLQDGGTEPIADLLSTRAIIYGVLNLPTRALAPADAMVGDQYQDGTNCFMYLAGGWKQLNN